MKAKISVFGYGKLVAKLKLARERKSLNEEKRMKIGGKGWFMYFPPESSHVIL